MLCSWAIGRLEDVVPAGARATKHVTLGDRERPLRLFRPDLDKLPAREAILAPRARTQQVRRERPSNYLLYMLQTLDGGGAGRSSPQCPASKSVLAPCAPPVMVWAGARPVARVHDVHCATRSVHEEPGTSTGDSHTDHALAPAREVGNDNALGTLFAGGEARARLPYPLKLALDALRDGLRYSDGIRASSSPERSGTLSTLPTSDGGPLRRCSRGQSSRRSLSTICGIRAPRS